MAPHQPKSEQTALDLINEIGNTLANFTNFRVKITRQVYNYGVDKMIMEVRNITMKRKVDFAFVPYVITSQVWKVLDFTMQISRRNHQLYVRPIQRYTTNWQWLFEVVTFISLLIIH